MNISIDIEKTFDKTQQAFMIKVLERVRLKGTYLNTIKAIYKNIANSIYMEKNLKQLH